MTPDKYSAMIITTQTATYYYLLLWINNLIYKMTENSPAQNLRYTILNGLICNITF